MAKNKIVQSLWVDELTNLCYKTIAYCEGSHAGGIGTIVTNNGSTTIKKYNNGKSDTLVEIGVGSDDSNRKNGLEIYENGRILTS
jgi:hypothetical protein